ncbi:MAG: hypothetical protein QG630_348 [Patescibacteria group bacterium]|nr:hypothetical protein [Patescibacteria group bacterium]
MKINKLKNILKITILTLSVFLIEINNSFAQTDNGLQGSLNFKAAANNITNNILTSATTLLMTAGFVLFFWGVVRFLYDRSNGDDSRLQKDKEAMLWGLIALFVIVSTWGIIRLAQDFLGLQNDSNIQIKSVEFIPPSGGQSPQPWTPSGPFEKKSLDPSEDPFEQKTSEPSSDPQKDQSKDFDSDVYPGDPITKDQAKKINHYLTLYKCFPLGVNSIGTNYGKEDAYIVKQFQKDNNLSPTGIIDTNTWKAFTSGIAKECIYSKFLTEEEN